jgi:hypothetical protein
LTSLWQPLPYAASLRQNGAALNKTKLTDMTKLIVAFHSFANATQNQKAQSTLSEEELDPLVVELVVMAEAVSHYW